MEDPIFQIAYEASRRSMSEGLWQRIGTKAQAALIYREMRRIDEGRALPPHQSPNPEPRGLFHSGADSRVV